MHDLISWLIGIAVIGLIVFWYAAERRWPTPLKPRPYTKSPTVCAWCIHRAGDDCTHPESPVSGSPAALSAAVPSSAT
jgi:high-affinity Fe2+/Pb2+ permease